MPLLCIVDNSLLSRGRLDNDTVSNRGRALSFLTFFARFASIIFIPLADWLVRTLGWRDVLIILADVLAVGAISLHALILRPRPQDLGLLHDGDIAGDHSGPAHVELDGSVPLRVALRGATFWSLSGGGRAEWRDFLTKS
jgi:MFS family permease